MEMELREQLLTEDHGLWIAWLVYKLNKDPSGFERAANAVRWQIRDGLIEMLQKYLTGQRVLEDWEVRQVLADLRHWRTPDDEAVYFLHLTEQGAKRI